MQTKLMFSQEDSHANPTQWQASDSAKKMTATSGQKCLEQLERLNPDGSLARMFSALLIGMEGWYSTRCKLTWKLKGTKYSRMYCQLAVSTHHTSDLESGLLLTPTTREEVQDLHKFKKRMEKYPNGTTMPNLATQIKSMLLTPSASDGMRSNMKMETLKRHNKKNAEKSNLAEQIAHKIGGGDSHLSPQFIMEMMGFPTDWTLLPFLNGEANQSKQEATQ
jgi:hypothetical protein